MRSTVLATLVLASLAVAGSAPEQAYLASRDAYIAKFAADGEAGNFGDDVIAAHDRALGDLERQLRPIVEPVALPGFSPDGVISLETLFDGDIGFGLLDGLVFGADEGDGIVLVTTEGLADAWLAGHRDWWGAETLPDDLRGALKDESFYTQAISADAAVVRFVELPVTPPPGADFAYAMLDLRTQDIGIGAPDEIIVAVMGGGRVFLASVPAAAPVHAIEACDRIWQDYEARAEAAAGSTDQSGANDEDDFDAFDRLYAEGEAAFHDCYAAQAKEQDFYPAVVAEAQSLVDKLH